MTRRPREVLEKKVRTYLKESVALQEFWNTPVTTTALRHELDRMVGDSRLPDRLREIRAALGNDDGLLMETLVRETLVDRLSRSFLAGDERLQAPARREADELRQALADRLLDPAAAHPRRTVVAVRSVTDLWGIERRVTRPRAATDDLVVQPPEFEGWRRTLPAATREAGSVIEHRDSFEISVVLSEERSEMKLAVYSFPKVTWDAWWAGALDRFEEAKALVTPRDIPALNEETDGRWTPSPAPASPPRPAPPWSSRGATWALCAN